MVNADNADNVDMMMLNDVVKVTSSHRRHMGIKPLKFVSRILFRFAKHNLMEPYLK